MSKFINKLSKKASSSKRYHEGAVECTDFECVSFQDKPYQLENRSQLPEERSQSFSSQPCRFERNDSRQSFSEGTESKYSTRLNQSSIASVNNLNPNDRKLSQSHIFNTQNPGLPPEATAASSETDQIANLQRKRPGSARYRTTNGIRHGSSSSLSSASSVSSGGSYHNSITNGFGHPAHAEILQSINQSLNQLSLVQDIETGPLPNAPPKPKRPSTDRVKTTMAFYANKPSFSADPRNTLRQVC